MNLAAFRFRERFTGITDEDMQLALDETEAVWFGVRSLWSKLPQQVRDLKRELCMNYLSAWYIADLYPKSVIGGLFTTGGVPLSSKSIDGVSLSFKDRPVAKGLEQLQSNAYGLKALDMIVNAPDMLLIHG